MHTKRRNAPTFTRNSPGHVSIAHVVDNGSQKWTSDTSVREELELDVGVVLDALVHQTKTSRPVYLWKQLAELVHRVVSVRLSHNFGRQWILQQSSRTDQEEKQVKSGKGYIHINHERTDGEAGPEPPLNDNGTIAMKFTIQEKDVSRFQALPVGKSRGHGTCNKGQKMVDIINYKAYRQLYQTIIKL
jgi:hypothetical protein